VTQHGINSEFIEKVKQANNITGVASRFMTLKQRGRTHWACCPFHHEKTPSMAINEVEQFYKCFGCGVSGDVISLVQQLEGLDFYGAIAALAKMAGMEMPAFHTDDNYAKLAKKKQRALSALALVCDYYCQNLYEAKNKEYLEYLHKRGINDNLIKMFNIGVSSDWNDAIKFLNSKGYTNEELKEAGIAAESESGRIYDSMAMRITFSVFNLYGDCIGFSGRTIQTNKEVAKYKNTAATIVFDKSNIVYGVDVLKKNKLANYIDHLIVVEGNIDVISLVAAGFNNVVACMGTAMTQFHAKIFKRFSDKVYICFDGDAAGQKAAAKGLDILAAEGLGVRVITLPDNGDPDDYVKKNGKDGFNKLIDQARPLLDYKLDMLEKNIDLKDNIGKTKYLDEAVIVLAPLRNTPQLELYVPRVSRAAGVSFDAVVRAINKTGYSAKPTVPADAMDADPAKPEGATSAYARAVTFIVASALHNQDFANLDDAQYLDNVLYSRLLSQIKRAKKSGSWQVGQIFSLFTKEELKELDSLITYQFEMEKSSLAKYYEDSVKYLKKYALQKQLDALFKQYATTDDLSQKTQIMQSIAEIGKRMKG
jgi:DNA primase